MATTAQDFSSSFEDTNFTLVHISSNIDDDINGEDFFQEVETYWMSKVKNLYFHIHNNIIYAAAPVIVQEMIALIPRAY